MTEFIEFSAAEYIPANMKLFSANLERLGKLNDGGYVVDVGSVEASDLLMSCGYGFESTFELAYLRKKHLGIIQPKVNIFDGSISLFSVIKDFLICLIKFPYRCLKRTESNYLISSAKNLLNLSGLIFRRHIKYSSKYIGSGINQISLSKIIPTNKKVFLKMDIEGAEYGLIDELIENRDSITGFVIEFHDIRRKKDLYFKSLIELCEFFKLVHVHPNNYSLDRFGFDCIELSFSNTNTNQMTILNDICLLNNLDSPNCDLLPEIKLIR